MSKYLGYIILYFAANLKNKAETTKHLGCFVILLDNI